MFEPAKDKEWETIIANKINNLNNLNPETFDKNASELFKQVNCEKRPASFIKSLTLFYIPFSLIKNMARCDVFFDALMGVTDKKKTVEEGLLTILDSFFGCSDQASLKYRLLNMVCDGELHPKSDEEAEGMVQYAIEHIKNQSDKVIELPEIKPSSLPTTPGQ